jgi:F0F1-type ATP synthase membrane subunit c/vacuolar-type H+-ATPase subunit K
VLGGGLITCIPGAIAIVASMRVLSHRRELTKKQRVAIILSLAVSSGIILFTLASTTYSIEHPPPFPCG